MDWKLEVVVVPVSDLDTAKAFYLDQAGFDLQVDHQTGDFRVIHFIPRGSAVAVALMENPAAAGSLRGMHLVVTDIEAARAELVGRAAQPCEIFHFVEGAQQPGSHPDRADYGSFFESSDPDGNAWLVQEVVGTS